MQIESIKEKIGDWGDSLVEMVPNFALAILVLVIFATTGKLVRRWVQKVGYKISDNKAVSNLFALFAYIGVVLMGLTIALKVLNLDGAATSILAGAGIVGVALGFAFQDIAANFISGIVLATQRPFKIGDLVETNETFGNVRHISLRSTEIETLDGQYVHIPNKELLLNPLTDYSHKGKRRVDIDVGVAYSTDLPKAEKVAIDAVEKTLNGKSKDVVDLYYSEFADSSITFTIRFWAPFKKQTDYLKARSDAIMAIKAAFDKEDINIPFPIRTMQFRQEQLDQLSNKRKAN